MEILTVIAVVIICIGIATHNLWSYAKWSKRCEESEEITATHIVKRRIKGEKETINN